VDGATRKRTSLRTANEEEARQSVEAKNQAVRQPVLNLQIAKPYRAGGDKGIALRTWLSMSATCGESLGRPFNTQIVDRPGSQR